MRQKKSPKIYVLRSSILYLYKINEKYYGRLVYGWYVMFYINIYEDENHVIYALAIFRDIMRKILGTHYNVG